MKIFGNSSLIEKCNWAKLVYPTVKMVNCLSYMNNMKETTFWFWIKKSIFLNFKIRTVILNNRVVSLKIVTKWQKYQRFVNELIRINVLILGLWRNFTNYLLKT